jgi:Rad3-related DNA helicase
MKKCTSDELSSLQKALTELEQHAVCLKRLCKFSNKFAVTINMQMSDHKDKKEITCPCFLEISLLQPGVIFDEISEDAHSIILASGTLTPLGSFFSELGDDFARRQVCGKYKSLFLSPLSAGHVIDRRQLLIQRV